MEGSVTLSLVFAFFVFSAYWPSVLSAPSLLGVHPLDEKYFDSEKVKCKDGSSFFSRDRLNDNFCDCVDGTDEPGTSACPRGRFYCRNMGGRPKFLFSSNVNDNICDCCDGSDEYDGSFSCPNTCVMGGNIEYKAEIRHSTVNYVNAIDSRESKVGNKLEELIQNLEGLKALWIIQLVVFVFVLAVWLFRLHATKSNSDIEAMSTSDAEHQQARKWLEVDFWELSHN
ncbi:hypothetical protein Nepgr_000388 [Nepenthes gracilis]|uniref:Glucosidase II beta subunit N-terminal domain-containing protein n=1 Tax=Nepenthes gracilis TaxID=150966 RepID=A0AAD3RW73_NEPGR|nr:hypothetical protein Nepgr_000388 [Nepenthes gracilis]